MVAPAIPVSASPRNLHSCSLERSPKSVSRVMLGYMSQMSVKVIQDFNQCSSVEKMNTIKHRNQKFVSTDMSFRFTGEEDGHRDQQSRSRTVCFISSSASARRFEESLVTR